MKKPEFKWNVWNYSFCLDRLEVIDVVPTFVSWLGSLKKKDIPETKEALEKELRHCARYHFWAKCEYEMVIHSWPGPRENEEKVDVYDQLQLNWDHFVDLFWDKVWEPKLRRRRPRK